MGVRASGPNQLGLKSIIIIMLKLRTVGPFLTAKVIKDPKENKNEERCSMDGVSQRN